MPHLKITTDSAGRKLYWIKTPSGTRWQRVSGWWAEIAIRKKMVVLVR